MTKEELYNLLDEVSLPDSIISRLDAPKWQFWKRKAHIKGNEIFPFLREYIEQKNKKSDTKIRENSYTVLVMLLLKNMEPAYCQFLIDRLNIETDKHVLHTMLSWISRLQLPVDIDITAITARSKSDEWLVRQSAILALSRSDTDTSREAVRYWVAQEDERKYKFELIYANAALGYIGELCDIDLLERHTHSPIHDIKDSSIYAIDNIRQRLECASSAAK